jgi:type II secretion system protein L
MRQFEGFMAKHTLTLDIKAHGIDWVLLRAGLRSLQIEKSGQLVCRVDDSDSAGAVAALKALRESIEAPGLTCIAAIEGRGLFARSLKVPFRDRRKVRQILPLELEATLPVAIETLALDFQMTGNGGTHTALSAALPKAQLDFYLQLLREAGLDPVLVTFSGLPAAMLLAAGSQGEANALLIDGDTDHCIFFLVGNHQLFFLRSWTPPATADPDTRLQSAIAQTIEAAARVRPDAAQTRFLYLTPRAARHYDPEHLAATLDLEVTLFDATLAGQPSLTAELSAGHGQGALALGLYEPLAEKGLNLFRSPFPLRRFVQQNRKQFIRTGALAATLVILFLAGVFIDIHRNEARATALRTEAEAILKQTFPETRNIVNPLQQMIVKLREARSDDLTSPRGARATQIDTLRAISQSLPPTLDIHVTQLVAGAESVQINGTTGTFEAVNEAKGHLEKSGFFDMITIISANMDQRTSRVRFKLSADLPRRP